ncbi:MAG: nitrate reductase cytochrome c-type subunit [Zoogloeaceae bacterium]|jgi:cytochrome c-type protein NapB|nr:nitrate reductase cytochrome c-type subunit [Zoogloeaceae bacterium]
MKKRFLAIVPATVLATGLMFFAGVSQAQIADDGGLVTLRGTSVSAPDKIVTGDGLKRVRDTDPLDRNFTDQPPLVSHAIDGYRITREANRCMDCHSWENARKEKATKISKTHFEAADGKVLSNVSSRRYFCVQCHVPQIDAKPLVSNTFQRAK